MLLDSELKRRKSLNDSRELYDENVKEEKIYANNMADVVLYGDVMDVIGNLRTTLKIEDIVKADADRINELKDKQKAGELSDKEKEELELRERGDLFLTKENAKKDIPYPGGAGDVARHPTTYALRWQEDIINGVLDGQSVFLKYASRPSQGTKDFGFEEKAWYEGQVGEKELEENEAKDLFHKYVEFARMRTREIMALKEDKERAKLGRTIKKQDDRGVRPEV